MYKTKGVRHSCLDQKKSKTPPLDQERIRKKNIVDSLEDFETLNAKIDDVRRLVKKMTRSMHVVTIEIDHILLRSVLKRKQVDVCYLSGDRYSKPRPRKGWISYDDYIKKIEIRYKQYGQDMKTKFATVSEKKHNEFKGVVKRMGVSTKTTFRNQQASIVNIENQCYKTDSQQFSRSTLRKIQRKCREKHCPLILANVNFEPNGHVFHLLKEPIFSKKDDEDSNQYLEEIMEMIDCFNILISLNIKSCYEFFR
ncbi:hypothetical protein LXL04_019120 [Taraxacum kok-saghyz]